MGHETPQNLEPDWDNKTFTIKVQVPATERILYLAAITLRAGWPHLPMNEETILSQVAALVTEFGHEVELMGDDDLVEFAYDMTSPPDAPHMGPQGETIIPDGEREELRALVRELWPQAE